MKIGIRKYVIQAALHEKTQRNCFRNAIRPDRVGECLFVFLLAHRNRVFLGGIAVEAAVGARKAKAIAPKCFAERIEHGKLRVTRLATRVVLARKAWDGRCNSFME